ncbi:uncharacterized protein LOC125673069 isoform X2 [Ostrea edulis]|uniref:uncharacterized protein LOC125673069 isoform X2 n=1 Tax=Ostrea edulis TaxID=37623 RepID=UPI0024AF4B14|nr:uncharacterized protein LOC125673069 isoform X2 [Ostrea edulis]
MCRYFLSVWAMVLLVLTSLLIGLTSSAQTNHCKETDGLQIRYVDGCPTTKDLRIQASRRMICSWTTNKSSLSYHCVINPSISEFMEVCAKPVQIIGGHCAEYNSGGERIQPNVQTSCQHHEKPCPSSYWSVDAYKYTGCYALVKRNTTFTEKSNAENEHNSTMTNLRINHSTTEKAVLVSGTLSPFLCVIMIIAIIRIKIKHTRELKERSNGVTDFKQIYITKGRHSVTERDNRCIMSRDSEIFRGECA